MTVHLEENQSGPYALISNIHSSASTFLLLGLQACATMPCIWSARDKTWTY